MTSAAPHQPAAIDPRLDLHDEISRLKRERNAVLLAHYYQDGEIQDLADFLGDSLQLAQQVTQQSPGFDAGTGDVTCGNWTSTAADGRARLGHFDKQGGGEAPNSWNSAHLSNGCTQPNLVATGGAGLFYCFAAN